MSMPKMFYAEDRREVRPFLKAHPVEVAKPSLCIPAARGGRGGLLVYIVETPALVGEAQYADFRKKAEAGWRVALCRDWDQARNQIGLYLKEPQ